MTDHENVTVDHQLQIFQVDIHPALQGYCLKLVLFVFSPWPVAWKIST